MVENWSELPSELLNLISQRIDNEIDLLRFRSICSHWRSSSISNLNTENLPFQFSISFDSNNTSFSKRNIFLIKPPLKQTLIHRPWLIRFTQNSSGKIKLSESSHLPFDLPSRFSLDLTKLSALRFGTDFIIDEPSGWCYKRHKKVVPVTPRILAILRFNGHMVLFRFGDKHWTEIPNIMLSSSIGDICIFKGWIYAVDEDSSRTVTVAPEDLSVELVAMAMVKDVDRRYGWIDLLVESQGELLLVNIYKPFSFVPLTIGVYRLDEKEKEWVKLTSLGDRVLFLSDGCSFSTSALDLCVTKGNCVVFMDDYILNKMICESGMSVFDMDQGRLFPLHHYPDYFDLFWSAPDLIDISCMRKPKKSMLLSYIERFLIC